MAYKVVSLDLSLTGTGIAVAADGKIQHIELVGSKGKEDATLTERARRLRLMRNKIRTWYLDFPALVVIEGPTYGKSGQGHQHDRSGLWWLIVNDLYDLVIPVVEASPGSLKKYATGSGSAGKDKVLAAAVRRYTDVDINDNNIADAVVLAAMGSRALGHPVEDSLPAINLTAMGGVKWPTPLENAA